MKKISEKNVDLWSPIIGCISDIIVRFDPQYHYLDIITGCEAPLGKPFEKLLGKTVTEVLPGNLAKKFKTCLKQALKTDQLQKLEYSLATSAGKRVYEAWFKASEKEEIITMIRDITDKKIQEKHLLYLAVHDQLTGLYNRTYFEEELKKLDSERDYPIIIISANLDGLKFINETMGFAKGDEMLIACADILKRSLRSSDILARIGGDEFTAILPRTDKKKGEVVCRYIKKNIAEHNRLHQDLPLILSLGVAFTKDKKTAMVRLFKHAVEHMYQAKRSRNITASRSKIVEALLAILSERDYLTEGHSRRLACFSRKIGERKGLSAKQLENMSLLSRVHDLGKVGIPDTILLKKGPLTKVEWKIMCLHPEKGYRIAVTVPGLAEVAELILMHHERWDGMGYPLGLTAEEIPIECRIIAIIDAYDAITNDRPYHKAASHEHALAELKRCAGSQFDPELVRVFLAIAEEEARLKV